MAEQKSQPHVVVPGFIDEWSLDTIEALMIGKAKPDLGRFTEYPMNDTSLRGQLGSLGINSDTGQINPPDAVFLTYLSCLPIADAIKGVYTELGLTDMPPIYAILSQRYRSCRYFEGRLRDDDKRIAERMFSIGVKCARS